MCLGEKLECLREKLECLGEKLPTPTPSSRLNPGRGCITWWEGQREEGLHHLVGGATGGGITSLGGRGNCRRGCITR